MFDIKRKLNSVGKESFIVNFELYKKYYEGKITKEDASQYLLLVNSNATSIDGQLIRLSNAKLIFKNKNEINALKLCLDARLSLELKKKAKIIIDNAT